jgi:hypothetical protein
MWTYIELEKNKSHGVQFCWPCQEFVFECDVIDRVQTFKYLGILLKTTSNLDSVVEHLAAASRRSSRYQV